MKKNMDESNKQNERFNQKVAYLENPEKRGGVSAEGLKDFLQLQGNEAIVDLGAGTGYFSIPLARETTGAVYALDFDDQMLEFIGKRVADNMITNIHPIKARIENIPLSDASVDVVIASLVLHETNQLETAMNEVGRVLKPGGTFVCIELEKEKDTQHNHPRLELTEMEAETEKAKLHIMQIVKPSNETYMLLAQKLIL